jgi:hypothetical protein
MTEFKISSKKSDFLLIQIPIVERDKLGIIDGEKILATFRTKDNEFKTQAYLTVTSGGQLSTRNYGANVISEHYKQSNNQDLYCNIRMGSFEAEFIEYYKLLKELIDKHIEFGYGKSTRLSEGFTENLCRYLFDLYTIKDRKYDAVDSNNRLVEIKSTCNGIGTTTISTKSEFDYLLWLSFDINTDEIKVYKINYEDVKSKIISNNKERITISLKNFTDTTKPYKVLKIDIKNKTIK